MTFIFTVNDSVLTLCCSFVLRTLKPRLHQIHVAGYMQTDTSSTRGYKWIQLVSGLHVSCYKRGISKLVKSGPKFNVN